MLDPTRNYAPKAGKERFQKNLDAIKLMRELETAGRHATAEEQERLLAYTGWGWMKEAFNSVRATKWANKQVRVRAEYDRAKAYFDREQSSSYGRYASDPGTWEDYIERLVTDPEDTTDSKLGSWVKNYLPSYERLRAELTEAEFTSAAKSVRNAHFTDVPVIGAMWKLVRRLGFKGGNALEPGAGIGHFIGTQPGDLADRTRWNAVELDSVTARILAHLYPEATVNGEPSKAGRAVEGQGFQEARVPNNSQDLVISNVPFDATGPGQSISSRALLPRPGLAGWSSSSRRTRRWTTTSTSGRRSRGWVSWSERSACRTTLSKPTRAPRSRPTSWFSASRTDELRWASRRRRGCSRAS